MNWGDTFELIANYGVMIIISGVFIWLAIQLSQILVQYIKKKTLHKSHDKLMDARTTASRSIHALLVDLLTDLQAERLNVIEFSNSVMSVAYMPFRYMTCTYEVHDHDRLPVGHTVDKLSTSLFTSFFTELQKTDEYSFGRDDMLPTGAVLCQLFDSDNAVTCVSLRGHTGKFIGYIHATRMTSFTDAERAQLRTAAAKISALLTILDV